MFQIEVNTRQAIITEKELLTSGSVGIEAQFVFSDDWDGLTRTAVFRRDDEDLFYAFVLDEDNKCTVPHEVLADAEAIVYGGAFGQNESGAITIPTVWVSLGAVKQGVTPGNSSSADPSPTQWAQIQGLAESAAQDAESARELAQSVRDDADSGAFDGDQGPTGPEGPQGPQGEQGDPGITPDLGIGTVSTLPAGSQATATITGTAEEPILNLGIPAGANGATGATGATGIAVQSSEPQTDQLAWIDTDETDTVLLPEMHLTTTPNVLDMGTEYLDATSVYDTTQGKTQAEINEEVADVGKIKFVKRTATLTSSSGRTTAVAAGLSGYKLIGATIDYSDDLYYTAVSDGIYPIISVSGSGVGNDAVNILGLNKSLATSATRTINIMCIYSKV